MNINLYVTIALNISQLYVNPLFEVFSSKDTKKILCISDNQKRCPIIALENSSNKGTSLFFTIYLIGS